MSCCTDSYNGLPCCCHLGFPTTTTTTCPFEICCDPSCDDGVICPEVYLTDCVRYDGPNLPCHGIFDGNNYTQILETILTLICSQTTTTTTTSTSTTSTSTTTTTTTADPCSCLTITNNSGFQTSVVYIACQGLPPNLILPSDPGFNTIVVCGQSVPDQPGVNIVTGLPCIQVGDVFVCEDICCNYTVNSHPTDPVTIYPVDCNGFYLPDIIIAPGGPSYIGCGLRYATMAYVGPVSWPVDYTNCPCTTTSTTTSSTSTSTTTTTTTEVPLPRSFSFSFDVFVPTTFLGAFIFNWSITGAINNLFIDWGDGNVITYNVFSTDVFSQDLYTTPVGPGPILVSYYISPTNDALEEYGIFVKAADINASFTSFPLNNLDTNDVNFKNIEIGSTASSLVLNISNCTLLEQLTVNDYSNAVGAPIVSITTLDLSFASLLDVLVLKDLDITTFTLLSTNQLTSVTIKNLLPVDSLLNYILTTIDSSPNTNCLLGYCNISTQNCGDITITNLPIINNLINVKNWSVNFT